MMTYTFILKGIEKMDFPKKISKRPEDLIRKLCRYKSTVLKEKNKIRRMGKYQKKSIFQTIAFVLATH